MLATTVRTHHSNNRSRAIQKPFASESNLVKVICISILVLGLYSVSRFAKSYSTLDAKSVFFGVVIGFSLKIMEERETTIMDKLLKISAVWIVPGFLLRWEERS